MGENSPNLGHRGSDLMQQQKENRAFSVTYVFSWQTDASLEFTNQIKTFFNAFFCLYIHMYIGNRYFFRPVANIDEIQFRKSTLAEYGFPCLNRHVWNFVETVFQSMFGVKIITFSAISMTIHANIWCNTPTALYTYYYFWTYDFTYIFRYNKRLPYKYCQT
jgi:hypothetical protein